MNRASAATAGRQPANPRGAGRSQRRFRLRGDRGGPSGLWDAGYEARILDRAEPGTREITLDALNHFDRISKPKRMVGIKTQTLDAYTAQRRTERGRKKGDLVSPAPGTRRGGRGPACAGGA